MMTRLNLYLEHSSTYQLKKKTVVRVGPPLTELSGSAHAGALASGARSPGFDPRSRRGKFRCPNTLSLVSLTGMTLDKCAVLRVGA